MLRGNKAERRRRRAEAIGRQAVARRPHLKARVIGITGSSGKTTSTALLSHILSAHGKVSEQSGMNSLHDLEKAIVRSPLDCDYLVAEAGIGEKTRIKPVAEILQPHVALITMVALEHKSVFRTPEAIAAEKGELVAALPAHGLAVLNGDDERVAAMAERTDARIVTFGRQAHNTYRAQSIRAPFPDRLSFDVVWEDNALALQTNFVGAHFWMPTLAAVSTALELGVQPSVIARQVASFQPLDDRCGVMAIPNGPQFILDTKKAPQHSLGMAFDIIATATAPRRRIVLGHISDGKGSSVGQYRKAYQLARQAADQVIFVGDHAHRANASQEDKDEGRFRYFRQTEEAADHIRQTAIPGEVILIKSSRNLHLERIALCWTTEVRCWETTCGVAAGCLACGLYADPFEQHKGEEQRGRLKRRLSKLWPHAQ